MTCQADNREGLNEGAAPGCLTIGSDRERLDGTAGQKGGGRRAAGRKMVRNMKRIAWRPGNPQPDDGSLTLRRPCGDTARAVPPAMKQHRPCIAIGLESGCPTAMRRHRPAGSRGRTAMPAYTAVFAGVKCRRAGIPARPERRTAHANAGLRPGGNEKDPGTGLYR